MTADELFEQASINWRNNSGIGAALVPSPLNDKVLIYQILSKVYTKTPNTHTVIIVESLKERIDIFEFLTNQGNENDAEFKQLLNNSKLIRVFTKKFISTEGWNRYADLCILYRPDDYDLEVSMYYKKCHYRLTILNKLMSTEKNKFNLFKDTPILECFKQTEIDELRVSSPVEEIWIDVKIPEDSKDWALYQYYCKYIETSINIFGSFDMIQQARVGNEKLNISAASIRNQIAEENGWNEHLDMSFEFNRKIDEMYNPNALGERATQTYEVIRNRTNLVADYDGKLEKVLEIVKSNADSKILIINKRGEFANKVTEYLNEHSESDICGNYHNKVDDIPAVDIEGKPVYIKSGVEKGKRKSMGYRAQMTLNQSKFILNKIRCLSLSNAPDKSLTVDFDTIIITSPLCEDVRSYLYRLSNIGVIGGKIKLFSIYCRNTIEQQKLLNKPTSENHTIVNKDEIMTNVKNNSDFIIVD